jgi:hypothetical protein
MGMPRRLRQGFVAASALLAVLALFIFAPRFGFTRGSQVPLWTEQAVLTTAIMSWMRPGRSR